MGRVVGPPTHRIAGIPVQPWVGRDTPPYIKPWDPPQWLMDARVRGTTVHNAAAVLGTFAQSYDNKPS